MSATATATAVTEAVTRALAGVDDAALERAWRADHEFVCLERWLPASLVERLVAEADRLRPAIHRSFIPRHKKGGSVSFYTLREQAPTIVALYRSPALLAFLSRLTGRALQPCPESDPHACALYYYTEPGDHIGFHFDTSYYRGARYTALVGLVERSSSRLVCQPGKTVPGRVPDERSLATHPGTVVFFNGDTLWHAITPLGAGEERVSLTLEYVTDATMSPARRFVSNMKDAIAYFGFRRVFLDSRKARRVTQ